MTAVPEDRRVFCIAGKHMLTDGNHQLKMKAIFKFFVVFEVFSNVLVLSMETHQCEFYQNMLP